MESVEINVSETVSDNEDDYGNYFLQPASSPYDIAEKVKQANNELFNENQNVEDKQVKVKFRENLVDYEPEFSYDDVSSIESEDNIDYSALDQDTSILESHLETALILNVTNSDEEQNEEVEEEEVIELIPNTFISEENVDGSISVRCENVSDKDRQDYNRSAEIESKTSPLRKNHKTLYLSEEISCKRHCIDSIDRFDFNSNIRKVHLVEKPFKCPRLKLQHRNCCENNDIKLQQKLPCYNGLRSEYGLNALQLERRERRNEILKLKEQERQRVIEERKRRKVQQNEEIFCEWLRSVSSRKNYHKNVKRKAPLNTTKITFPAKLDDRPNTAFNSQKDVKQAMQKKRPYTSSTCIFIEVPQGILENGISIGDLLVKGKRKDNKQLHLLTFS
ncbi:hypothetical protein PPYR_05960 [Photinus pyralis]|uniref:Coiled-coil domain-containing protein 181 n=1 Tax=Photinus pyralis TaxID=7054 RepID=A0A5N4ASK5_PHOPY|nr:stress response protein NST1 [Photinus pyralis]KAB0800220.1 hypothetical protein PPYR_05960 [Photinus pyralis]